MLKKFVCVVFTLILIFPRTAYAYGSFASSAVVIDKDSGKILYENNAYEERAVASTTKIMTALLVFESGRTDDVVTITSEMTDTEGSSLGLKPGDKITLYDIAVGMLLVSGNDAANSAAYCLAGSIRAFAALMNEKAGEIGMKNTLFVTPSGLDEGGHHSSAYDMALLTAYALDNPAFSAVCAMKSADIEINGEKQTIYNHNKLLSYDTKTEFSFCGVKTGYTQKAGRCLVSAGKYHGNVIICVTLNCPDDWNAHIYFTDMCLEKYSKTVISNRITLPAAGGVRNSVKCSYSGEFWLLEPVTVKEYYFPFVYAPIKKGCKIGEAVISRDGKIIERLPIKAEEDIKYYAG